MIFDEGNDVNEHAASAPATRTPSTARARLPLAQANHEPSERAYRGLARVAHVAMSLFTRRDWANSHKLPDGGFILVSNHMSYMDWMVLGEYVIWSGRWPRFLGKAELWAMPGIGWLARACGQIPVYRKSSRAGEALVAAEQALREGKVVAIFPEGTETRDPELWPMTGRTGAARLALQGGWPVVPVVQWGAQEIMPGPRPTWPRLLPRKKVTVVTGDPVDLDDLRQHVGTEREQDAVRAATDRILDAMTVMLAEIRGEEPPAGRWDMRINERVASRPQVEPR